MKIKFSTEIPKNAANFRVLHIYGQNFGENKRTFQNLGKISQSRIKLNKNISHFCQISFQKSAKTIFLFRGCQMFLITFDNTCL